MPAAKNNSSIYTRFSNLARATGPQWRARTASDCPCDLESARFLRDLHHAGQVWEKLHCSADVLERIHVVRGVLADELNVVELSYRRAPTHGSPGRPFACTLALHVLT